jgi:hypothetical protein
MASAATAAPRVYKYVIDSRDRNTSIYPTPSEYSVSLQEAIVNVAYIKLLLADVPFPRYLIHAGNNRLYVSETGNAGDAVAITLAVGNYDGPGLATLMQTALTAGCRATVSVAYSQATDSFTFTSTLKDKTTNGAVGFLITFQGPTTPVDDNPSVSYLPYSVARVIGFGSAVYQSSGAGVIKAPFRCNLIPDKYLVLQIRNVENLYGVSSVIDRSFGIINSKESDLNNEYKHDTLKVFEPVLNSLRRLNIAFYDYDGNLYDFQNQEHRLELEFGVWGQMRPGAYSPY